MNIGLISEPVSPEAIWITDIVDGAVRESVRKSHNLTAVTDGKIYPELCPYGESVLVVGYSKSWIAYTVSEILNAGAEPIVVSLSCGIHGVSSVCFDVETAYRELVHYTSSHCEGRIALFGFHRDTVGDLAKLTGYTAGMREVGRKFTSEDIYTRGLASDCAGRLLSNISSYGAVICTNDLLAIYLIMYLAEHGVKVPGDIIVTGFGNWELTKRFSPGITRMYTDLCELGTQAVRLHQYMKSSERGGMTHAAHSSSVLKCVLQVSDSTRNELPTDLPPKNLSHGASDAPLYSDDSDIMEVLRSELLLRQSDEIDRAILHGLTVGMKAIDLATHACVSESTVKYRISKMLRISCLAGKSELAAFASKYCSF